jgi:hypothetical protein
MKISGDDQEYICVIWEFVFLVLYNLKITLACWTRPSILYLHLFHSFPFLESGYFDIFHLLLFFFKTSSSLKKKSPFFKVRHKAACLYVNSTLKMKRKNNFFCVQKCRFVGNLIFLKNNNINKGFLRRLKRNLIFFPLNSIIFFPVCVCVPKMDGQTFSVVIRCALKASDGRHYRSEIKRSRRLIKEMGITKIL